MHAPCSTAPDSVKTQSHKRRHRSPKRLYRGCQRAAAIRALTAARLYLTDAVKTMEQAAVACGSNRAYVAAMVILVHAENTTLIARVLSGCIGIVEAAQDAKRVAGLVHAYRQAYAADHLAFAKAIGPETLFDHVVVPAVA